MFRFAIKSVKHIERLWFTATSAVFRDGDRLARLFAHPWMGIFLQEREAAGVLTVTLTSE